MDGTPSGLFSLSLNSDADDDDNRVSIDACFNVCSARSKSSFVTPCELPVVKLLISVVNGKSKKMFYNEWKKSEYIILLHVQNIDK